MRITSVSLEDDVIVILDDWVDAKMLRAKKSNNSNSIRGATDFINTVARRINQDRKLQILIFGKAI